MGPADPMPPQLSGVVAHAEMSTKTAQPNPRRPIIAPSFAGSLATVKRHREMTPYWPVRLCGGRWWFVWADSGAPPEHRLHRLGALRFRRNEHLPHLSRRGPLRT